MRQLLVAGVMMGTIQATAVFAADAVVDPIVAAPAPAAVVADWSGFFVGIQAGAQWSDANVTIPAYPSVFGNDDTSFVGGAYVGYDFQVTPSIVVGVEADANWIDGSATALSGNPILAAETYTINQDWDASIRARLGYSTANALLYLTGGVAFTELDTFYSLPPSATVSDNRTGWNVGGGAEILFTPNISGRLQYLYTDFGTASFFHGGPSTVDFKTHKIQAGISWRFN